MMTQVVEKEKVLTDDCDAGFELAFFVEEWQRGSVSRRIVLIHKNLFSLNSE